MQTIIGLILAGTVAFYMIPAVASHDTETIQRATDQTIEKVTAFSTNVIVHEVEGLPLEIITNEFPENK
jgi:uncharacterized membrane protein YgaE (UPF0421/DUF939 family)